MAQSLQSFLEQCRNDTVLLRIFFITVTFVWGLTPLKKPGRKSAAGFAGRFLCFYLIYFLLWGLHEMIWRGPDAPAPELDATGDLRRVLLAGVFYTILFCRYERRIRIIMSGSLMAVTVTVIHLSYTAGTTVAQVISGSTLPMLFAVYGLAVVFAVVAVRCSLESFAEFPKGGFILLVTSDIIVLAAAGFWQVYDLSTHRITSYGIFIYCVLYILIVLTYLSVYLMCAERDRFIRSQAENHMIRATAQQIELTEQNQKELRKIRHDMKNQIAYMNMLLKNGEYKRLEELLDSLSEWPMKPESLVDCGNPEISAILSMNAAKLQAKGQKIEPVIVVPPVLPFDSRELCSVISNLIDNAAEANVRYGVAEPVKVQLALRSEYFYIGVTNAIPANVDRKELLRMKTSKGDTLNHGLGTGIVQKIAEKYGGYTVFDVEKGRFIAEVLLDMEFQKGVQKK